MERDKHSKYYRRGQFDNDMFKASNKIAALQFKAFFAVHYQLPDKSPNTDYHTDIVLCKSNVQEYGWVRRFRRMVTIGLFD